MTQGALLQLVAYGAQDVYLTANPQVTFFKQLYRRHSNFAMEAVEQTFNGVANFGKKNSMCDFPQRRSHSPNVSAGDAPLCRFK